jgi:hypothetical protein
VPQLPWRGYSSRKNKKQRRSPKRKNNFGLIHFNIEIVNWSQGTETLNMQNKHKQHRDGEMKRPPELKQHFLGMGSVIPALVILAVLASGWHHSQQAEALPSASPMVESGTANSPSTLAEAKADWQKLQGKWTRPDGGYILEIRNVDDSGKMDAGYFNPKSIHVAKAEATRVGGILRVFIELRDENYPGSTYTLTYDPASDQLKGIYFQALQKQSYEVVFVRTKRGNT